MLRSHEITVIVDMRSIPRSKFPYFNQEYLQEALEEQGIQYIYLGEKFGRLKREKDYDKNPAFQECCQILREGASQFRMALLCRERKPEKGQRYLVSRYLQNEFDIHHILANGSLVSHDELESQLSLQSESYTKPHKKKIHPPKNRIVRVRRKSQSKFFLPSELVSILEHDLAHTPDEYATFSCPVEVIRVLDLMIRRRFASHLRDGDKYVKPTKIKPFFGDRWMNISSKTLQIVVGKGYSNAVKELAMQGIIERSFYNKDSHKTYGYRFTDRYKNSRISVLHLPPKDDDAFEEMLRGELEQRRECFEEQINQTTKNEIVALNSEGYHLAYRHLDSLTLECDENDLKQIEENLKSDTQGIHFVHRMNMILFKCHEIVEGKKTTIVPFYSIDKYGRFHYFLTNLPEVLRPFIRMNGKKIVSYDITTSQCVFFAMSVRDEVRDGINFNGILKEIEEYYPQYMSRFENTATELKMPNHKRRSMGILGKQKWCLEYEIETLFGLLKDDFYTQMMTAIGWTENRSEFKKAFFLFLYGPNFNWKNPIIVQFQKAFPHIYLMLWEMKQLGDTRKRLKELKEQIRTEDEYRDIKDSDLKKSDWDKIERRAKNQLSKEGKDEGKFYGELPRRMQ